MCWCGCGDPTPKDMHFVPGHDGKAVWATIRLDFDGTAASFLVATGHDPNGKRPLTPADHRKK